MNRRLRIATFALLAAALALPAGGSAHDFEETRRLVVSVEADRVLMMVAYEVRPGRIADGLRARYDASDDGVVETALERLARVQTIGPRVRHGLSLVVRDEEVPLTIESIAFPAPPREGSRSGIRAVALYAAELPDDAWGRGPLSVEVRTRGARGQLTLEAQAAEGYEVTADGLESRRNDPVLGPGMLSRSGAVTLMVRRAAAR